MDNKRCLEKITKKNRKGALSPAVIVGVVLVLVAFGLVAFFYSQVFTKKSFNRETCHQSVIMRGSLPEQGNIKRQFPLKCKTRKVCIGGDCGEFMGEENVVNKKNIYSGKKGEKQIEKILTKELVSCWQMMGEGKVSLFSKSIKESLGFKNNVYAGCVVCSRIAFNKKSIPNSVNLSKVDPVDYMMKYRMPRKEVSYYKYLTKEEASFKTRDDLIIDDSKASSLGDAGDKLEKKLNFKWREKDKFEESLESDSSTTGNTKEIAIIFQQISESTGRLEVLKNSFLTIAGAGAGGHFATRGLSTTAAATTAKTACGGLYRGIACALIGAGVAAKQQLAITGQKKFVSGYCGDISYGDDVYKGCSSVRMVNYNIENIKSVCPRIESIP